MVQIVKGVSAVGNISPDTTMISVVIPCFNSAKWVGDAIRSVIDQDFNAVEVVVIDDGSTDDSVDVLKQFDGSIVWETGPNKGACTARNRGAALARGEYLLFLDADDYLSPGFLRELVNSSGSSTDMVIGAHIVQDEAGNVLADRRWPSFDTQTDLMAYNVAEPLQTGAFLWRRDFVLANGGWDETLPIAQDTDFAIRMVAAKPQFGIVTNGVGHVVWRAVGGDTRITTALSHKKLSALLSVFKRHSAVLRSYNDSRIIDALALRFFGLARIAYVCGDREIGDDAVQSAQSLGLSKMPESILHRILSAVFGFRVKTILIAEIYRFRFKNALHRRPYPYNLRSAKKIITPAI